MLFRKSTRAIVTGKRIRMQEQNTAAENDYQVIPSSEDSADTPVAPKKKKTYHWTNVKQAAKKLLRNPVVVILLIASLLLTVTVIVVDIHGAAPVLAEGQVVVAVDAIPALSNQVEQGDIVGLYTADGLPIPELQYVQVYKSSARRGLLLLVDDQQATALVSQEINQKVVLIAHDDSEHASDLLDLQARINDPDISLTLQKPSPIAPGEVLELSYQLSADPLEAILPQIKWESSDPAVATVENGIVTAHGVGQVTISASCGNIRASCSVRVDIPVEEIKLDKTECSLFISDSIHLNATAEPSDATGYIIDWSIADPDIAAISADGTITGVSPGTTVATASCGNIKAQCAVTVGIPAEMVQLDKNSLQLIVGQTDSLSASIYPSSDVVDVGTFESSAPDIVAVSEDGTVTAIASGTATITFRCGEAVDICYVTVEEP